MSQTQISASGLGPEQDIRMLRHIPYFISKTPLVILFRIFAIAPVDFVILFEGGRGILHICGLMCILALYANHALALGGNLDFTISMRYARCPKHY